MEKATALAFLVDGDAYFRALSEALPLAERSIFIIGWDIDSRLQLRQSEPRDSVPSALAPFLVELVRRRPYLIVRILTWDFAMIYALEREPFLELKLGWRVPRQIRVRLDGNHPLGASHHQKIVVLDDAIAFVGGLDLSESRWDTPQHAARDPRRVTSWGEPYQPFHDVQLAVAGRAAAALGELARTRWRRATGERLLPADPSAAAFARWPAGLQPVLRGVPVGIARTEPDWAGGSGTRELEQLYLDGIAAARRTIYIENQYLTSVVIGNALIASLALPEGPEIVIVGPRECVGWLERASMGVLRARTLQRVRQADRHRRLSMLYPQAAQLEPSQFINVHSKLMIVDDHLGIVGSANLTNRSMGLDTECALVLEASSATERQALLQLRHHLLGEHVGCTAEVVQAAIERHGRLAPAIAELNGAERSLVELTPVVPEWLDEMLPAAPVVDPERPLSYTDFVASVVPQELRSTGREPLLARLALWAMLALLLAVWRWTPLQDEIPVHQLLTWGLTALRFPLDWALVLVASLLLIPVPPSLLVGIAVLVLGTLKGALYGLCALFCSGMASYGLGRLLGEERLRQLSRSAALDRLGQRLLRARIGIVAQARWIPLASPALLNFVAGAWRVPVLRFAASLVLGFLPGASLAALVASQLRRVALEPTHPRVFVLLLLFILLAALLIWLRHRLRGTVRAQPREEPV